MVDEKKTLQGLIRAEKKAGQACLLLTEGLITSLQERKRQLTLQERKQKQQRKQQLSSIYSSIFSFLVQMLQQKQRQALKRMLKRKQQQVQQCGLQP